MLLRQLNRIYDLHFSEASNSNIKEAQTYAASGVQKLSLAV
jgi:hypothetical protein